MAQRSITVKPRFWLILMALFLAVFLPLYRILDNHYAALIETRNELIAVRDASLLRVEELNRKIDYVTSDAGIEQQARALGMVMEGEIKINISGL